MYAPPSKSHFFLDHLVQSPERKRICPSDRSLTKSKKSWSSGSSRASGWVSSSRPQLQPTSITAQVGEQSSLRLFIVRMVECDVKVRCILEKCPCWLSQITAAVTPTLPAGIRRNSQRSAGTTSAAARRVTRARLQLQLRLCAR